MGRGEKYTDDYKEMISNLYKSGMTIPEISSEYGIAKSTIAGWVKDNSKIKVSEEKSNKEETIFHSDLGSQYTSKDMRDLCIEFNILQSFSKKGCPYDNACIESFHASIKKEEIYLNTYKDFEEAKIAIFRYIEGWYNNKRLHSAVNYKTPNEVELLAKNTA